MSIFYLENFIGTKEEIIAPSIDHALTFLNWDKDDVLRMHQSPIPAFRIKRTDSEDYVRGERVLCYAV